MRGARVLYNTYWVRFSEAGFSQAEAVRNTKLLFDCARKVGVERIVHVSITQPSMDSPFEYFRGKAELEAALGEVGVPYTILRPAVIFGGEDILINNIAWSLRHLPIFGIFGDGEYQLQPIHVEDLARLAVRAGNATGSEIVQAVGPTVLTYQELVRGLSKAMGLRRPVVPVPTWFGLWASRLIGRLVHDVTLTREEVGALMANLLLPTEEERTRPSSVGRIDIKEWMKKNAETLGRSYANELARRERMRLSTATKQPA